MQQDEVQLGKRITVNDPGQPWHGATGSIHSQDAAQAKGGVCIVLLDQPINVFGQMAQALSLMLGSLVPEPIVNRVLPEDDPAGIPVKMTLLFEVEYSVSPTFYKTTDARAILEAEVVAVRKDPKFALSQPACVLTVDGELVGVEEPPKVGPVVLPDLPPVVEVLAPVDGAPVVAEPPVEQPEVAAEETGTSPNG